MSARLSFRLAALVWVGFALVWATGTLPVDRWAAVIAAGCTALFFWVDR